MRRLIVNWATIAFVITFIYAVLSVCFPCINIFPIGEWGLLPSFAAIAVGMMAYDFVTYKISLKIIRGGKCIKYFPAFMADLERSNEDVYNMVMHLHEGMINNKINDLEAYIKNERNKCLEEFRSSGKINFNIGEEQKELLALKDTLDVLSDIKCGKTTWDKVWEELNKNDRMYYTIKYELGEVDEDEKNKIDEQVSILTNLKDGGVYKA